MDKLLVIFRNCQGYGLQSGNLLVRIPSECYQINLMVGVDTVYLVNEKGGIECVIIKDKEDYEADRNLDRRIQNNKNGFVVEWSSNGELCDVTSRRNKRKVNSDNKRTVRHRNKKILITVGILGLIDIVVFITAVYVSTNDINEDALCVGQDSTTVLLLGDTLLLEDTLLHNDSIRKMASFQKQKLQSMNCSERTVLEVRAWWQNQNSQDKKYITKNTYDFELALIVYSQIFDAEDIRDFIRLSEKLGRTVLSSRQIHMARRFHGKDYESLRHRPFRHMSFREIEMEFE